MVANGSGVPREVEDEIEEVYRVFSEVERYRNHREYYRLLPLRQMLVNLMASIAGVYASTQALQQNLNEHGNILLALGYSEEKIRNMSDTANEGFLSLQEPVVTDGLVSLLSSYTMALRKFLEVMESHP